MSIMPQDGEVEAMARIAQALDGLDQEAMGRVLRWAAERYKIPSASAVDQSQTRVASRSELPLFTEFADVYDSANPGTSAERALVAGYWLQVVRGQPVLDAQEVNAALKHLGHGVTNITDAFSDLMNRTPRLAMQLRKSGSSKQARKQYKLTVEGIRRVEALIKARKEDGETDGKGRADAT